MTDSPWLGIPHEEYTAHMSAAHIGQRQALDLVFAEALKRLAPRSLLVAGCEAGSGWEHIDPHITTTVTGIDLNPDYLAILHAREGVRLAGLDLYRGDILTMELPGRTYDLVVAALLFEYLDLRLGLERLSGLLNPDGVLLCVLQVHSESSTLVSSTRFENLRRLESVMHLVDLEEFEGCARNVGLVGNHHRTIPLPGGKAFRVLEFVKRKSDN